MQKVLERVIGVIPCGDGFKALCPCHRDFLPSLSISPGEGGRVVVHCFGGCETETVLEKLGLTWADLGSGGPPLDRPTREAVSDEAVNLRHEIYSQLVVGLELTQADLNLLRDRGLSEERIRENGYRSLDFMKTCQVCRVLWEKHGQGLLNIPGFIEMQGNYPRLSITTGVLIPVRDLQGRIIACQVRTGKEGRKYQWLSNKDASSHSPAHVPLGVKGPLDTIRVTEGPLKADVAWCLSGVPTIAVAGVSSWEASIPLIKELGVKAVEIAFDGDWRTKAGVAEQLRQFQLDLIQQHQLQTSVLTWDPSQKGLDDALKAGAYLRAEGSVQVEIAPPEQKESPSGPPSRVEEGCRIMRASEIPEEPVNWLWPLWIPAGAISILDGDPGQGKSTLTAALVASVTRGGMLPNPKGQPTLQGHVLVVTHEDSISQTVVPRLRIAGADLGLVDMWRAVVQKDKHESIPVLPANLENLEALIRRNQTKLVVVDPIISYLSSDYDAHRDQDVRSVLTRMSDIAQRTGCAFLLLRHFNKSNSQPGLYRGSGSIGFAGQARSVMALMRHPEEKDCRILLHQKSSLGPEQYGQTIRLEQIGEHSVTAWDGETDLGWDDIAEARGRGRPGGKERVKAAFLYATLHDGPKLAEEVFKAADQLGWTAKNLERARREVGVKSYKDRDKRPMFRLPENPKAFIDGRVEEDNAESES